MSGPLKPPHVSPPTSRAERASGSASDVIISRNQFQPFDCSCLSVCVFVRTVLSVVHMWGLLWTNMVLLGERINVPYICAELSMAILLAPIWSNTNRRLDYTTVTHVQSNGLLMNFKSYIASNCSTVIIRRNTKTVLYSDDIIICQNSFLYENDATQKTLYF